MEGEEIIVKERISVILERFPFMSYFNPKQEVKMDLPNSVSVTVNLHMLSYR